MRREIHLAFWLMDTRDELLLRKSKHRNDVKYDNTLIRDFVMLYHPSISHYRHENALNKPYLTSKLSITGLYRDFQKEVQKRDLKCSKETFRYYVRCDMNISFAKLGHEDCEDCAAQLVHIKIKHNNAYDDSCEICKQYQEHKNNHTKTRQEYEQGKGLRSGKHNFLL